MLPLFRAVVQQALIHTSIWVYYPSLLPMTVVGNDIENHPALEIGKNFISMSNLQLTRAKIFKQ